MLPVLSLNGNSIGDGKVGEVFTKILGRWSDNTGIDIAKQIKKWDAERGQSEGGSAPTPYRFKSK
jgi:branched-chain amino acid aminotransferase